MIKGFSADPGVSYNGFVKHIQIKKPSTLSKMIAEHAKRGRGISPPVHPGKFPRGSSEKPTTSCGQYIDPRLAQATFPKCRQIIPKDYTRSHRFVADCPSADVDNLDGNTEKLWLIWLVISYFYFQSSWGACHKLYWVRIYVKSKSSPAMHSSCAVTPKTLGVEYSLHFLCFSVSYFFIHGCHLLFHADFCSVKSGKSTKQQWSPIYKTRQHLLACWRLQLLDADAEVATASWTLHTDSKAFQLSIWPGMSGVFYI